MIGRDGVTKALLLQWGHVFSDVETRGKGKLFRRGKGASMGPRLFRRGNVTAPS